MEELLVETVPGTPRGVRILRLAGPFILRTLFDFQSLVRSGDEQTTFIDLTDCMYDPRTRPFVSHARGTELVIEHIETRWCPSILSSDLTRVIPGSDSPSSLSKF